jgi:protein-S-isoprenylcysteine O-methyltransferase Ste14
VEEVGEEAGLLARRGEEPLAEGEEAEPLALRHVGGPVHRFLGFFDGGVEEGLDLFSHLSRWAGGFKVCWPRVGMVSPPEGLVLGGVAATLVAVAWSARRQRRDRPPDVERPGTWLQTPTKAGLPVAAALGLAGVFAGLGRFDPGSAGPLLGAVGAFLLVIGVSFRPWAIAALGRQMDFEIRVKEGHRVMTEGPYRLVRHPIYFSSIATWGGAGLLLPSWPLLVWVAVLAPVYYLRARAEEELLAKHLPEYAGFKKRVPMLVPGLRLSR